MRTMQMAAVALAISTTGAALVHAEDAKRLQGFSIVLLLGDTQTTAQVENLSPPARKALADIKDFLPYKSYRVLDTQWVAGSDNGGSSGGLRGLDNENYEFLLKTFPRGLNPTPGTADAALGRAQFRLMVRSATSAPTILLDNSFNLTAGETVVVGTSRVQGDRALVVLLTAVAAGR